MQQQLICSASLVHCQTAGLRRECATPSNGHNAVIILQLAIPRTNRRDARQEPEATKGSTTEYSLLRPRAAAVTVSGCASEFYTRPHVTRIEDSRHREYEVPTSQHHHSIRTIHPYRFLALEVV
jgi:hypothetical protein